MAEDIAADRILQARLIKDMARRLRYSWIMYVLFCVFFAVQPEFVGRESWAMWAFTIFMLVGGILRMWRGAAVANLKDQEVLSAGGTLLPVIALHSVLWGTFIGFSFWAVCGNARLEMCIVIGIAGFATGGAVVLAAYPPLAWLHLGVQCGPLLVWSIFARERVGLLMVTLVVAFLIFIGALVIASHADILAMFRAQLLLEIRGEELRRAKETAEEASSARAQFLANMSHEIRTPLHGVLGLTQVLGQTPLTDGQKELLRALNSSGNHLLAIVNDILDCSKIASGKLTFEDVSFDLDALVRDVSVPPKRWHGPKGSVGQSIALTKPGEPTAEIRCGYARC